MEEPAWLYPAQQADELRVVVAREVVHRNLQSNKKTCRLSKKIFLLPDRHDHLYVLSLSHLVIVPVYSEERAGPRYAGSLYTATRQGINVAAIPTVSHLWKNIHSFIHDCRPGTQPLYRALLLAAFDESDSLSVLRYRYLIRS